MPIGALVVAAAWLGACAPLAPTGALDLLVTGLPPGVAADVVLVSQDGGVRPFTASARVDGLAPGRYEVVAADVCATTDAPCAATDLFRPALASRAVDVVGGAVREVEVHYGCALLAPPDPALGAALLSAVRQQFADPDAVLSCANVEALTSFDANQQGITDLEGLQHARSLESLSLWGNPDVADLTPIAGLVRLRDLRVGCGGMVYADCAIEDLTPVSGLVNLEALAVGFARVTDLPDLARLTRLRSLSLFHLDLDDLSPLASLKGLTELVVDYCTPRDFGGSRSSLRDITPLGGLRHLTALRLGCHDIDDVGALAGMSELAILDLRLTSVADLTPLGDLVALESLGISDNPIRSLAVASGWPLLRDVWARGTRVDDLRALYLHVGTHRSLCQVDLSDACVRMDRVPNAGYAAAITAAGVTLAASWSHLGCWDLAGPPPALATFEVDAEGWTTAGDAVNLRRVPAGGPAGGPYLEADDGQQGVAWYWQAGPVFLGDASDYLGGELVFALAQSATDAPSSAPDVILESDGRTMAYQHGVAIGTDWTTVHVPLVAAAGWTTDGGPATDTELGEALAGLRVLWIRGEYRFGADTGRLGYVRLSPPP